MLAVIGTKLDLVEDKPEKRQVTPEEGQQYAARMRASFYETSAKDNVNVTAVFDRIGFQSFASKLSSEEVSSNTVDVNNSRVVVAAARPAPGATRSCCSVQ